jgi:MATE family multidrug resistance protein
LLYNYTKEFRYNLKLASPVMLGMVGHMTVGFADNVMVGQLGAAELAAVICPTIPNMTGDASFKL